MRNADRKLSVGQPRLFVVDRHAIDFYAHAGGQQAARTNDRTTQVAARFTAVLSIVSRTGFRKFRSAEAFSRRFSVSMLIVQKSTVIPQIRMENTYYRNSREDPRSKEIWPRKFMTKFWR